MHFVDDDDLAHEPEVTHQHVARLQCCEQHLVDCADHNRRQGRSPALAHPPARVKAEILLVVMHFEGALTAFEELDKGLVEAVFPVRELDAELLRFIAQNACEPGGDALEHRVGRGLSGQRDKHSLQPPSAHQHLCGREGQLGLPGSRRRLDDHEVRVFACCDLDGGALRLGRTVRGRPPETVTVEVCGLTGVSCRNTQRGWEGRSLPCAPDTIALLVRGELGVPLDRQLSSLVDRSRPEREVILVGSEPVCDHEGRGIGGGHRDGHLGQGGAGSDERETATRRHPSQNFRARLTPTGIILARALLCPVLLSRDVHGTRVRVSTMVDTNENGPLKSTRSITATRSYFLLKRELTDEAMGQERTFRVVTLAKDNKALAPDQLRQILSLTGEANIHLTGVVNACEEHKRGPRLGAVSSPDRGHEPAVMLAQILIEEESRNVSGIHQVLDDGEPAAGVSTLRPEAPGQCGENGSAEAGLGDRENRGFRSRWRRQRNSLLVFSGHFLFLESKPSSEYGMRVSMNSCGYSENVEPDSTSGAVITPSEVME